MSRGDEDEAWRAIVENYGERAPVDEAPPSEPEPQPFDPTYADLDTPPEDEEDRFVPPVPPPGPPLRFPDHLPWIGVLGSPAVLVLSLLTGIELPAWAGYSLVGAFVGGFLWLVLTMRREPRDPWDNGARV